MYVPTLGASSEFFNKYRWFFLWDQFNKKWLKAELMNEWQADKKIDWWRATHPDYYAVGTPHLLEEVQMVYWTGKKWQRYCQFYAPGCVTSIV